MTLELEMIWYPKLELWLGVEQEPLELKENLVLDSLPHPTRASNNDLNMTGLKRTHMVLLGLI